MFSNKNNLNADSNYEFIKKLTLGILKQRPDWHFLYVFPNNPDWSYRPDGYFQNKHIHRVPMLIPSSKKQMVVNFDSKWWYSFNYNFAFDAIINNTPEITTQLMAMQQTYTKEAIYPIINQHHYITHSDLPYPTTELGDKGITMLQLSGTYLGNLNIVNSDNTKKMLDDNYKKYWGNIPQYPYKKIYFGFDIAEYEKHKLPKRKEFTFVYNHRLQDYKNWRDTFDVFDILWQKGYRFKVIVTSISAKSAEIDKKPYVEKADALYSHDAYLNFISQGHVNMTNSQHETFCISAMESMIYKQPLIAPRKATFPEITPKAYKYLFDTQAEQVWMCEQFLKNPELLNTVGNEVYENAKTNFTEDLFIDNWISTIEGMLPNAQEIVESLKKQGDLEGFLKGVNGKIPVDIIFRRLRDWIGQRQAFTNIKLKRILNYYGYTDLVENGRQYFVK